MRRLFTRLIDWLLGAEVEERPGEPVIKEDWRWIWRGGGCL